MRKVTPEEYTSARLARYGNLTTKEILHLKLRQQQEKKKELLRTSLLYQSNTGVVAGKRKAMFEDEGQEPIVKKLRTELELQKSSIDSSIVSSAFYDPNSPNSNVEGYQEPNYYGDDFEDLSDSDDRMSVSGSDSSCASYMLTSSQELEEHVEVKPKSDKQKKASKAGRIGREQEQANPNPIQTPCQACINANIYDHNNPHASRRANACPLQTVSMDQLLRRELGNHERFVRKIRLETVVNPDAVPANNEFRDTFITKVTEIVNYVREVSIKLHLFINYYLLNKLEGNEELTNIIFLQPFTFACLQRIIGQNITTPNPNVPVTEINRIFDLYQQDYPDTIVQRPATTPACANVLASLATESALCFSNHVIENFQRWTTRFLCLCLREHDRTVSDANSKKVAIYLYNRCTHQQNAIWPTSVDHNPALDAAVEVVVREYSVTDQTPVSPHQLSLNTVIYFRYLYNVLRGIERHNQGQILLANEVQVEASISFGYQSVQTIPEWLTLGRRRRSKLVRSFVRAINTGSNQINFGNGVSNNSQFALNAMATDVIERIGRSRQYIEEQLNNVATTIIRQFCFCPESYTFVKQQRVFSLFPSRKLTRPYVYIDYQTLGSILVSVRRHLGLNINQCRLDPIENLPLDTQSHASVQFARFFRFSRMRLDILDNGHTRKENIRFTNLIRTDGYGTDFIFARSIGQRNEFADADLDLSAFDDNDITIFRLWGADPGITSPFVASDDGSRDPTRNLNIAHEVRKMSASEFYTRAGYKLTNKRIREYKEEVGIVQIESELLSSKVATLAAYRAYLQNYFERLPPLIAFYDQRFSRLRMMNYQGRCRAEVEMAHIFINGGRKYNRIGMKQQYGRPRREPKYQSNNPRRPQRGSYTAPPPQNPNKWTPSPLDNTDPRIPLIALGDAQFASTMRGTLPGLANTCRKILKRFQADGSLMIVSVDEYLTSQICSKCGHRSLENMQLDGGTMHAVQVCTNCNTVWQRDVNASRNIYYIAEHMMLHGTRPVEFRRPETASGGTEATPTTTGSSSHQS